MSAVQLTPAIHNWEYRKMPLMDRFMSRVMPVTESGCWFWVGSDKSTEYGAFTLPGASGFAHRASWIIFNGPIPRGLYVLHKCDIRCCVNPDHLFLGTHQDNCADMKRKGRRKGRCVGSQQGSAKLNEAQAAEIFESTKSLRALAREYGVSQGVIWHIKHKLNWKHIHR